MSHSLTDQVRARYGAVAASPLTGHSAGVAAVAAAFGYTPEELAAIPAAANMGLSCGNPVATANLRPGETVVDLGCGGGLDVLLAAAKVGPTGRAIGVDMTPEMIARAQRNAAQAGGGAPLPNVEFLLGSIEALPLPDATADCLISNCVINLAADKLAVFRDMRRVLRPGGRAAISDIALKQPLPAALADDLAAYIGCIGGALLIDEYERLLSAAGFTDVQVIDTQRDLNAYALVVDEQQAGCGAAAEETPPPAPGDLPVFAGCCSTGAPTAPVHGELAELLRTWNINDFAASVQIYALKPRA